LLAKNQYAKQKHRLLVVASDWLTFTVGHICSAIDAKVCNVNKEMIIISFLDTLNIKARTNTQTSNKNSRLDPDPSSIIAVCTFLNGN